MMIKKIVVIYCVVLLMKHVFLFEIFNVM